MRRANETFERISGWSLHNDATIHDRFWAEELVLHRLRRTKAWQGRRDETCVQLLLPRPVTPRPRTPPRTYEFSSMVRPRLWLSFGWDHGKGRCDHGGELPQHGHLSQAQRQMASSGVASDAAATNRGRESKDVAAAEAAFNQAMLASDVKQLGLLSDSTFIMTRDNGNQVTQKQLLDFLSSGQLKYSRLETKETKVSLYGDTAVVRGVSLRQHSAIPGSTTGDCASGGLLYVDVREPGRRLEGCSHALSRP